MNAPIKQHLIDPEICIRCNTCEETCPVDAITHNEDNYVVRAETCEFCMDCIAPCPTGAIDNWRVVRTPYPIEEQMAWTELPAQDDVAVPAGAGTHGGDGGDPAAAPAAAIESLEEDVERLLAEAHAGAGGRVKPPASASKPSVNLYSRRKPAVATVQANYRVTAATRERDVHHIILDLGNEPFPVLEGQSVGIVPPGARSDGKPHALRLYSVASPRDGEKPNTNNIALTVKREERGVCSNYLCDLNKGDTVALTGPFGATFLMPNSPDANVLMICTGTGSAPFRGFTMRRQRQQPNASGRLILYFGARTPEELPYFGPLKKVPAAILTQRLVFSRLPGEAKEYVQHRMIREASWLAPLIGEPSTHIFICGLKGMEAGVDAALDTIAALAGRDWAALKAEMRESGRYHVETY